MKTRIALLICGLVLVSLIYASSAYAEGPSGKKEATSPVVAHTYDSDTMRVQGEQRFRANCGRCHAAPQKFPPKNDGDRPAAHAGACHYYRQRHAARALLYVAVT